MMDGEHIVRPHNQRINSFGRNLLFLANNHCRCQGKQ